MVYSVHSPKLSDCKIPPDLILCNIEDITAKQYRGFVFSGGRNMNIEKINSEKLLISLCDKELEEYNLTYEGLSFADNRSKRVIEDLLIRAESKTGMKLNGKKLMIEAMKYDHGCILLVTVVNRHKRRIYSIKSRSNSYAFSFTCAEELLSCIEQLYRANERGRNSSILFDNRNYYLMLGNSIPSDCFMRITGEYAHSVLSGKITCSALREKCSILAAENALEVVGSTMI